MAITAWIMITAISHAQNHNIVLTAHSAVAIYIHTSVFGSPQPPAGSYPAKVNSSNLHTASSIFIGHTHHTLVPPSATMATSYQPRPAHTQRVRAPPKDNIPFDYYPG